MMQAMSGVQTVRVGSSDVTSLTGAEIPAQYATPVQAASASPVLFDATGALVERLLRA